MTSISQPFEWSSLQHRDSMPFINQGNMQVSVNLCTKIFGIYRDKIRYIYIQRNWIKWMRNNFHKGWKKQAESIGLVPGSIPAGADFFLKGFMHADKFDLA